MSRQAFRRSRRPKAIDGEPAGASVGALEAELALLREDNARLKAAQHRPPDLGAVVDRVRALPAHAAEAARGAAGDEAAQLLAEGLELRDSLLHVCEELASSIALVESRLRDLGRADDAEAPPDRVVRWGPGRVRDHATRDGGLRVTDAA